MFRYLKATVVGAVAAVALAWLSPGALAHITVNPNEASSGGFAKLAFRVPNERDAAGTTAVEVNLPIDHPLAFVSVRPKAGWTYNVERTKLSTPIEVHGEMVAEAVTKVTWSGGPIRPGEFDEFELSAGPMPEGTDQLVFKALQTYEGGEIVRWIEDAPPGGAEPEHPAPVLKLVKGADEHGSSTTTAGDETAHSTPTSSTESSKDNDSQVLEILALGVAAAAFTLGLVAVFRRRPT